MSTDVPDDADEGRTAADSGVGDPDADAGPTVAELREEVERLREEVAAMEDDDQPRMTIIATKGTLDMAYPPLILASTAAAFGWDVVVFHTFWGLDVLHEEKSRDLKLSAVGNPSLPVPNAVAALPFMDRVTTGMMERRIEENGTPDIEELIEVSIESGVDLQACQMTMDLLDYDADDLYDGVTTDVGAATALQHMADADVQLLV